MGKEPREVHEGQIRTRTKGFISLDLALLIGKGIAIAAALGALAWGVHKYNDSLREDGRTEVRIEWGKANLDMIHRQEVERNRQEGIRATLAKQYYAEKITREDTQRQLDNTREELIHKSTVASNICFDDGLRNDWNRNSGFPEAGKPRDGVAPKVPGTP